MLSKQSLPAIAAASTLALMMAGCGSSGGDDSAGAPGTETATGTGTSPTNGTAPGPAQAGTQDAFLAQVRAVINTTSETAETAAIDSAPTSSLESAEAEPLS
jgi:hypothetical protein